MNRRLVKLQPRFGVSAISAGAAALLTTYYAVFGSVQLEEIRQFSYSIAAGSTSGGWLAGPRVAGTFSWGGVPLYDALQGVGARLPYKGAWYSSLEWPLRLVVDWQVFVFSKIFLSTFAFLALGLRTLRSWCPDFSNRACFFVAMLFVAPAPRFLRWEEWTVEWSQTAAIAGLVFVFLRKELFTGPEDPRGGLFLERTSYLLVAVCLAELVTGHPGNIPNALVILMPLALALASHANVRQRVRSSLRHDKARLSLLAIPPVTTIAVILWEIRVEWSGKGSWARDVPTDLGGVFPDQAFVGFTRGLLPTFVERVMSVVFSNTFEPLARLLVPYLPRIEVLSRTTGDTPQGAFMGLLAVMVGTVFLVRRRGAVPLRRLVATIVTVQVAAYVLSWAAQDGLFPPMLVPSGAYKTFIMLIPLNVLLTVVMLHRDSRVTSASRRILFINLALVVVYFFMQFDLVSSSARFKVPERYDLAVSALEAESITGTARAAVLGFDELDSPGLVGYAPLFGIPMNGKPLLQSAAEMRDTNNIRAHGPTEGGYGPIDMTNRSVAEVSSLLDFFQVGHALVRDNALGKRFLESVDEAAREREQSARQPLVKLAGSPLMVWDREGRFVDVLVNGSLTDERVCPVLDRPCPIISETSRRNVSSEPKLSICNDPCLWTYEAGRVNQGEILVIPVSFDRALRVEDSRASALPTRDIAGFLGVVGPISDMPERLTVTVEPDSRMYSLVLNSYVTLLAFIALVALLTTRREVRTSA